MNTNEDSQILDDSLNEEKQHNPLVNTLGAIDEEYEFFVQTIDESITLSKQSPTKSAFEQSQTTINKSIFNGIVSTYKDKSERDRRRERENLRKCTIHFLLEY